LIGETPFRMLMADTRFAAIPMVIETPKSNDLLP
jgi:endonuclease IV